jgi:hypothetical protein
MTVRSITASVFGMNNFCLLPVQANERGKFHRERRAVKERMLRDVGVRHVAIDLRILSTTNALVSRLVDLAKKQTVQAWDNHVGTSVSCGMAEETLDQPHLLDQSGSDGLSGAFFGPSVPIARCATWLVKLTPALVERETARFRLRNNFGRRIVGPAALGDAIHNAALNGFLGPQSQAVPLAATFRPFVGHVKRHHELAFEIPHRQWIFTVSHAPGLVVAVQRRR